MYVSRRFILLGAQNKSDELRAVSTAVMKSAVSVTANTRHMCLLTSVYKTAHRAVLRIVNLAPLTALLKRPQLSENAAIHLLRR